MIPVGKDFWEIFVYLYMHKYGTSSYYVKSEQKYFNHLDGTGEDDEEEARSLLSVDETDGSDQHPYSRKSKYACYIYVILLHRKLALVVITGTTRW